jgi:hypothetical protein
MAQFASGIARFAPDVDFETIVLLECQFFQESNHNQFLKLKHPVWKSIPYRSFLESNPNQFQKSKVPELKSIQFQLFPESNQSK